MNVPGFSAEMSLYQTPRFFVAAQFNGASPTTVIAQRIKLPTNPGWKECMNDCMSHWGTMEECYNSCTAGRHITYGYYF